MELEREDLIEGEIVTAVRALANRGWGSKAIARELGIARNTVRRYRRRPIAAGQQVRVARRLTEDVVRDAQALYTSVADQNAVVVHRLLRDQGRPLGLRTVQRAVAPVRQARRAAILCRCLQVTRSGFYAWQRRPESAHARRDRHLRVRVRASHDASRRAYGRPRIWKDLVEDGERISEKRVGRLMREEGSWRGHGADTRSRR